MSQFCSRQHSCAAQTQHLEVILDFYLSPKSVKKRCALSLLPLLAPGPHQQHLFLVTQHPTWSLLLLTCSPAVYSYHRHPINLRVEAGVMLTATKLYSLSSFQPWLFLHSAIHSQNSSPSTFPWAHPTSAALGSYCPSSTQSMLLPQGLRTDYSFYLECNFQRTPWPTPLPPLMSAQMSPSYGGLAWKSYSRLQPPLVNNPVSLILLYSFSLYYMSIFNVPFNSLIHYVCYLLPVFPPLEYRLLKTRIFVGFVHPCIKSI